MSGAPVAARRRGRPPAATPEQVIDAATVRYQQGERIDVRAIATELGLGRATIYRWFGSREALIGEVLYRGAEPLLENSYRQAREGDGPILLDTFDRFNRHLAASTPLRRFVEAERDSALRIITSGAGLVQPRLVARMTEVIEAEVAAGRYDPPVDPATLAYAIVKLAEAFLFNDAVAGMRGDVDRLREVEAALLGVGRRS